ncbi:hypothetical protein SASPL_116378 [Salvia splendens]|uniref:Uncharacterized protein n=1 Tax=Salvia splendens TaxID=180675 RepID=A0A8X8XYL8_SALSN|nr:hypothetical protein SASPL_116378 [Salvia splendens]
MANMCFSSCQKMDTRWSPIRCEYGIAELASSDTKLDELNEFSENAEKKGTDETDFEVFKIAGSFSRFSSPPPDFHPLNSPTEVVVISTTTRYHHRLPMRYAHAILESWDSAVPNGREAVPDGREALVGGGTV